MNRSVFLVLYRIQITTGEAPTELRAGPTVTLVAGQRVWGQYGTVIQFPNNAVVNLTGHHDTVYAFPGTVVTVNANAYDPTDNLVTTDPMPPEELYRRPR